MLSTKLTKDDSYVADVVPCEESGEITTHAILESLNLIDQMGLEPDAGLKYASPRRHSESE